MKRRSLLKLGLGAAVVLGIAGGGVALWRPGLIENKLSPTGRELMRAWALAIFDGAWGPAGPEREQRLAVHLDQIDIAIAGLPSNVRAELSQLLALLNGSVGRMALTGLQIGWATAPQTDVSQALESMRVSALATRQQIYHALRELHCVVFFTEPRAWPLVGYPGPRDV